MTDYSLLDIIEYIKEYEEDSDVCDVIWELIHGTNSQAIRLELEEFVYDNQIYAEKTFHLDKKFIERVQDDYYEGKSYYHCESEITDIQSNEKYYLSVAYMNDELLEVSLEPFDGAEDCCEEPHVVEILARIDGEFNVKTENGWEVKTPADLGLGKKKKLNFKMCTNCCSILE